MQKAKSGKTEPSPKSDLAAPPAKKKKKKLPRWVYLSLGWFFTALGMVGIPLPILPTTPFLLLAAFFFLRSSRKFFIFLLRLPKAGDRLRRVLRGLGMTMGEKITALLLAWSMMGVSWWILRARFWAPYLFIGLIILEVVVMIRIPTFRATEAVKSENKKAS